MSRYWLQFWIWTVFLGALVLVPAGTMAYPGGWAFITLFSIGGMAMIVWMARYSPSLLRERMGSPIQRAQKPWDRVWLSVFVLGFLAWVAFMSRDASRHGFHAVSPWLQVLGGLAVLANGFGTWWTFRENTFAAPVVKIQEGQKVIDTGPYAFVRHPMYASTLFFFIGLPLLLGSLWGLAIAAVFILSLAWRTVHEERTLRAELAGYDEYASRVRYRWIPYFW